MENRNNALLDMAHEYQRIVNQIPLLISAGVENCIYDDEKSLSISSADAGKLISDMDNLLTALDRFSVLLTSEKEALETYIDHFVIYPYEVDTDEQKS